MKLIYVTNVRIPTEKAHGVQIMKMCEAFAFLGLETELVVPKRVNSIKDEVFEYYGIKDKFVIRRVFSLDLFWLKLVPEKISFYIQSFSFSLAAVARFILTSKKETIFYSRDYLTLFFLCFFGFKPAGEIHDFHPTKHNWLVGYILKKSRILIVNSRGTENLLRQYFKVPAEKLVAVPNGVSVDFFDIKESRIEARQMLGMPLDKTIIGYVGNLETAGAAKGLECVLENLAVLFSKNQQNLLYVIGGQNDAIQKYKKRLEELKIPDKRAIFIGHVKHAKVPFYLRAIDVVIVPKPQDKSFALTTSPMKIFEFLAAGKMILAADLPSIKEYLNEKNAILFDQEKKYGMCDKLEFILNNPDIAQRLSKQAASDARQYSWLSRARKIKELIG